MGRGRQSAGLLSPEGSHGEGRWGRVDVKTRAPSARRSGLAAPTALGRRLLVARGGRRRRRRRAAVFLGGLRLVRRFLLRFLLLALLDLVGLLGLVRLVARTRVGLLVLRRRRRVHRDGADTGP